MEGVDQRALQPWHYAEWGWESGKGSEMLRVVRTEAWGKTVRWEEYVWLGEGGDDT